MTVSAVSVRINLEARSSLNDLPAEPLLRRWAEAALAGREAEFSVRIVDEAEARRFNRAWRQKDYASNVLSFPVGDPLPYAPALLGDLVICAPVVAREARQQGKESLAHWAHILIHGILHLCGHDHALAGALSAMEREEIRILRRLGYANPYMARPERPRP